MGTGTRAADIVGKVNDFCELLLYKPKQKHLVQCDEEVLKKVDYHYCPGQLNRIDCGLFCVGVVLHLLDGIEVDRTTYTHQKCSHLRFKLSTHFTHVVHHPDDKDVVLQPTGQVVRDCFPLLQGTTIVGAGGVEDITPTSFADMSLAATTTTTTRSTTKAMAAGVEDDDSDAVVVLEERSGRERGRRNAEKNRRALLALKNAARRVTTASSPKPNPNVRRPRKPRVLSYIDSDDRGELSEQYAMDSVNDQVLQHLLVAKARGESLSIP